MSLTSVLKSDRELARRLANLLPTTGAPRQQDLPMRASPKSKNYALIGTAFDYLLRFEIQRRNPSVKTQDWVASAAVDMLKPHELESGNMIQWMPDVENPEALAEQADKILSEAKIVHDRFIRTDNLSEEQVADVACYTLRLAKLDGIYRSGIIDPALESVNPLDVQDLLNLWKIVPFDGPMSVCLSKDVRLNPTFGRFSTGIHGADADVIASTMLIDIKTSIHPDFKQHAAQLVGYAMLAQAYRAEEAPSFPTIESVGIYFARQGVLVALPMEPVRMKADFVEAYIALLMHCADSSH